MGALPRAAALRARHRGCGQREKGTGPAGRARAGPSPAGKGQARAAPVPGVDIGHNKMPKENPATEQQKNTKVGVAGSEGSALSF